MIAAGVPCAPGYHGEDQSAARFAEEARRIGYPLMVKASAGGGGRGMRVVREPEALEAALRSARAEAESAFGDGRLLLERALLGARHVEIQVFGDEHGAIVHLGERDCSIQRRHQKLIEESPSPAVSPEFALGHGRGRSAGGAHGRLRRRRHRRISSRRRRKLLFSGDEYAHPGRAPGDGMRHRDRPRSASVSGRSRARAAVRPIGRRLAAVMRSKPGSMRRTPRPTSFPRPAALSRGARAKGRACGSIAESKAERRSGRITIPFSPK